MNRRSFIQRITIAGCYPVVSVLFSCSEKKRSRPNIVWIMAEDIGPELACYGYPLVKTPNLDRLASEGIRYSSAFCTAPVCSPSRSAMITGMYQTSINAHNHRSHRDNHYELPSGIYPITHYLREAGYYTAVGCGYSAKTDFNFFCRTPVFEGEDWNTRQPGQPFFAQISLNATHRTFKRDKENPIDPALVQLPPYYPDHPILRRDWADYLESIQLMDRQVGEIMARLAKEDLLGNTAVIFIGDNGRCHLRGKQWLYEGGIHIPLIVRWPGEIEPAQVSSQLVSSIDISATVLYMAGIEPPDHMEGRVFLGKRLKPRTHIIAARDRCDETVDRIRCVRTDRYKYIRNFYPEKPYMQMNAYKYKQYPAFVLLRELHRRGALTPDQQKFMAETRTAGELYDLETDPFELKNLAGEKNCRSILSDLKEKLDIWMGQTQDKGMFPEPSFVIDHWKREANGRLETFLKEMKLSINISDEDYMKWWEKQLRRPANGKP